jgi:putative transposase
LGGANDDGANRATVCCALSGLGCFFPFSQGGAARLAPLRSALGWYVAPLRGNDPVRPIREGGGDNVSQSLVKNLVHLVYSTKHRERWIPTEVQSRLFAYQAGIFQEWDSPALVIGGVEDHVHALFSLSKNHALKKIVEEVKKGSSKWMKAGGTGNADFHWQNGYGAFSVSQSSVAQVRHYIEDQAEHHRQMTFQEELRALYRKHEMEFDERYVWD